MARYADDLALAHVLADTADSLAMSRFRALDLHVTSKPDLTPVSDADTAVEKALRSTLARTRPRDGVLGEEYGSTGATGARQWVIDPIDGTVNYLYGLPQYAVSIAAEADGEVIAGVVVNAASGEEWHATLGGGAWRGDRRLSGSTQTVLAQALVGTGFAYSAERRAVQGAVVAGLITRVRDIRRFGSAALDLCAAAEGMLDAYYERGLNPWDLAAGGLIAREAGLLVTGLSGKPAGADLALAAPPALHKQLHDQLVELDADSGP